MPESSLFADLTIITEGNTSSPSIDLDPDWDELTQLRWKAAVVAASTGTQPVEVHPSALWRNGREVPGYFSLAGRSPRRSWSWSALDFHGAWHVLSGIHKGIELTREEPNA